MATFITYYTACFRLKSNTDFDVFLEEVIKSIEDPRFKIESIDSGKILCRFKDGRLFDANADEKKEEKKEEKFDGELLIKSKSIDEDSKDEKLIFLIDRRRYTSEKKGTDAVQDNFNNIRVMNIPYWTKTIIDACCTKLKNDNPEADFQWLRIPSNDQIESDDCYSIIHLDDESKGKDYSNCYFPYIVVPQSISIIKEKEDSYSINEDVMFKLANGFPLNNNPGFDEKKCELKAICNTAFLSRSGVSIGPSKDSIKKTAYYSHDQDSSIFSPDRFEIFYNKFLDSIYTLLKTHIIRTECELYFNNEKTKGLKGDERVRKLLNDEKSFNKRGLWLTKEQSRVIAFKNSSDYGNRLFSHYLSNSPFFEEANIASACLNKLQKYASNERISQEEINYYENKKRQEKEERDAKDDIKKMEEKKEKRINNTLNMLAIVGVFSAFKDGSDLLISATGGAQFSWWDFGLFTALVIICICSIWRFSKSLNFDSDEGENKNHIVRTIIIISAIVFVVRIAYWISSPNRSPEVNSVNTTAMISEEPDVPDQEILFIEKVETAAPAAEVIEKQTPQQAEEVKSETNVSPDESHQPVASDPEVPVTNDIKTVSGPGNSNVN